MNFYLSTNQFQGTICIFPYHIPNFIQIVFILLNKAVFFPLQKTLSKYLQESN